MGQGREQEGRAAGRGTARWALCYPGVCSHRRCPPAPWPRRTPEGLGPGARAAVETGTWKEHRADPGHLCHPTGVSQGAGSYMGTPGRPLRRSDLKQMCKGCPPSPTREGSGIWNRPPVRPAPPERVRASGTGLQSTQPHQRGFRHPEPASSLPRPAREGLGIWNRPPVSAWGQWGHLDDSPSPMKKGPQHQQVKGLLSPAS